jgi:type VI secretion system protein ImpH
VASRPTRPRRKPELIDPPAERLLDDSTPFDFFQAVWLLERMDPRRRPVGYDGNPSNECVRFRAHQSLSFPPSAVFDVAECGACEATGSLRPPLAMTVTFMGLTGSSGVLPRHYTELLLRLEREAKGAEKHALRAWLDLFNHRLISLFYRAWEKYRFYVPLSRGPCSEPDAFTSVLSSLIGLGQPALRKRLRVSTWEDPCRPPSPKPAAGCEETNLQLAGYQEEHLLAEIDDLGLLRYSGMLAQRPRTADNLQRLLIDYFGLPARVLQFQSQWLILEQAQQTNLAIGCGNCQLGVSAVVGERVWDVQGKIRVCLGPLTRAQFDEFLPDHEPAKIRKAQFLLAHLVRLFVGPQIDFDVQLQLRAAEVPQCQLTEGGAPRLGWNTWLLSRPEVEHRGDAVFAEESARWL